MIRRRRDGISDRINTALISALLMIANVSAKHLTDLRWNSANILFGGDSNGQRELFPLLTVEQNDDADFLCPTREASEWLTVSLVSEMSFLTCQLDSSAVEFLVCDSSDNPPRRKPVSFGGSEAANNGIVFTPGHSYYFITTSSGSKRGLRNTFGGLCATKNMRLKIDVVYNSTHKDEAELSTLAPSIEYLIEERDPESTSFSANEAVESNAIAPAGAKYSRSLADILHVKPEHIDFVRRHAVNGGTGAIAFPNSNAEKRPRFIETARSDRRNQDFYTSADDADRRTGHTDEAYRQLDNVSSRSSSQFNDQIDRTVDDISLQNNYLVSMKVYARANEAESNASSVNLSTYFMSTSITFLIFVVSSIFY